MSESQRADALILPESLKEGARFRARLASVFRLAEPFLKPDYAAGERMHVRRQHGGVVFITRSPHDTLRKPVWHPQAGAERYRWDDRGHGIRIGYLLDPADVAGPAPDAMGGEELRELVEEMGRAF